MRYDELNRLLEVKRAGILTASYTRDEAGNVTALSDGRGGVVLQTFDRHSRLESRSDGAGNITRFEYDLKGRLAKKTEPRLDAGGQPLVTSYEYNEFDSLTKVVDAARNEWVYGYDQNQRLTTIDDPTAHPPTRLEYTPTGRVSKVIRPDGVESVYEYDGAGNRTLAIDTAGHRVRTTYDAVNRPKTITVTRADGSLADGARGYAYEFDPEGNLTRVDERLGFGAEEQTRSYLRAYDSLNRLVSATDPFGRTVSYRYDPAGNLATLTDPTGRATTYSYDAFNRVQAAQLPGLAQPVEYQWFPDGLMKQVTYPAGMSRVYEYDEADRVSRILNTVSAAESEEYVYGYDANGNRSTETRRQNGAVTRELSYGYDPLNRLTSTEYRTPNLAPATTVWGYDAVGNRLAMTGQMWNGSPLDVGYMYNSVNQLIGLTDRVDPAKSLTMEYDGNGNLSRELSPSGMERRFVHDAFNQLRQVSLVTPPAQAGGTSVETALGIYDYDFEGRRIHRWSAAEELYYVYNGLNVLTEYDRWNQVAATYDFGLPGGMIQQAQWQLLGNRLHSGVGAFPAAGRSSGAEAGAGAGWVPDFGPPGDLIRANFATEGERFYFHDTLGSTTMLAGFPTPNSPPAVAARYDYDPWGTQLNTPQPSLNRVNFTTYRNDAETSLNYALARYHGSAVARFLEQDPLPDLIEPARVRSVPMYFYSHDNPLVRTDASGRSDGDDSIGPNLGSKVTAQALKERVLNFAQSLLAYFLPEEVDPLVGLDLAEQRDPLVGPGFGQLSQSEIAHLWTRNLGEGAKFTADVVFISDPTMVASLAREPLYAHHGIISPEEAVQSASIQVLFLVLTAGKGDDVLRLAPADEARQLLVGANRTSAAYLADKFAHLTSEQRLARMHELIELNSQTNPITRRLRQYVGQAEAYVDSLGDAAFTPRQRAAIQRHPWLRKMYRGSAIEVKVRVDIRGDPLLQGLKGNPSYGPDFVDAGTGVWWDITTQGQWQAHVGKYGQGGILLRTK
ncbi:MAG: RHS repeat protein [Acidobacteria bacterium]|nr:MAG: RHS repeat protein [Acidobacteriota bacterium]